MSDAILRIRSAVASGELEGWGDWTDAVREAADLNENKRAAYFRRDLRGAARALDTTIAARSLEICGERGYSRYYVAVLCEKFLQHVEDEIASREEGV